MTNTNSDFRVYECLEDKFDDLTKRVNSIARTIGRYGYELEFKELGREMKTVPVYAIDGLTKVKITEAEVKVVKYTFSMPDFRIENYTPMVMIEHGVVLEDDSTQTNMLHWFNSQFYKEVPEEIRENWKTIGGHCDDCHDKYLRQKTVMLRNEIDGSFRQIGMSCLKRYLGITAFNVIHNFMNVDELVQEDVLTDDDSYFTGGAQIYYVSTVRYIAACLRQIKLDNGYQNRTVTATKAFDFCLKGSSDDRDIDKALEPYMEKAKVIKAYFDDPDVFRYLKDGFESDVAIAVRNDYTKLSGLVAYSCVMYDKILAANEEKQRQAESGARSEYIGQAGHWLMGIKAKVQGCVTVQTQ